MPNNHDRLNLMNSHHTMFEYSDLAPIAGLMRTIPAQGGPYTFASAHMIASLLDELFARTDNTPESILAWTIDVLHIHPFYDGNRRACWHYANTWLTSSGYPRMDWEGYRPQWEQDILEHLSNSEKLKHILEYYKTQKSAS